MANSKAGCSGKEEHQESCGCGEKEANHCASAQVHPQSPGEASCQSSRAETGELALRLEGEAD